MASDHNPPDLELARPSWPVTSYRDILVQIGERLRLQYELPQELPDRLLTLLMQVTGREEMDKAA
jgi:hypothetical protein